MIEVQNLLDSGFEKLTKHGVELDHRARWDVKELTPLEKLAIILNDLVIEGHKGGIDYWIQRFYPAKGKYDLQKLLPHVFNRMYDLDPLCAEMLLLYMYIADKAPASYSNPWESNSHYSEPTEEESDSYQELMDSYRSLGSFFHDFHVRIWNFIKMTLEKWDPNLDLFTLQPTTVSPRTRIISLDPKSPKSGPIRFPSITVGITKQGKKFLVHTMRISVVSLYRTVAYGLWMGGASLEEIQKFSKRCARYHEEHDHDSILDICTEYVDINGTFALTGKPISREQLGEILTWTPKSEFELRLDNLETGGEACSIILTTTDMSLQGGGPEALGLPSLRLNLDDIVFYNTNYVDDKCAKRKIIMVDCGFINCDVPGQDYMINQILELAMNSGIVMLLNPSLDVITNLYGNVSGPIYIEKGYPSPQAWKSQYYSEVSKGNVNSNQMSIIEFWKEKIKTGSKRSCLFATESKMTNLSTDISAGSTVPKLSLRKLNTDEILSHCKNNLDIDRKHLEAYVIDGSHIKCESTDSNSLLDQVLKITSIRGIVFLLNPNLNSLAYLSKKADDYLVDLEVSYSTCPNELRELFGF